jgi:hypothetical protein
MKDKEMDNEDLDNELALYGVIQSIPYSLIKSSRLEAERYLIEPLLKKGDKKTYTKY